jgi:hypothetical protein
MIPVQTAHCNLTYTAPLGVTAEQCGDLPCERDTPHGTIKSWWAPSREERQAIASGGLIRFTCFSTGHPVISLDVRSQDHDFKDDRLSLRSQINTWQGEYKRAEKDFGDLCAFLMSNPPATYHLQVKGIADIIRNHLTPGATP